jgi:hypothetical protein
MHLPHGSAHQPAHGIASVRGRLPCACPRARSPFCSRSTCSSPAAARFREAVGWSRFYIAAAVIFGVLAISGGKPEADRSPRTTPTGQFMRESDPRPDA